MARPNILLILSDQHSGYATCGLDVSHLNTPALDWLANHGTRFQQAYCTQPLCVPSRLSMFTGHMPYQANVYLNVRKAPHLDEFPWLGKKLAENGYETTYFGKWHLILSPHGDKAIHGFQTTSFVKGGSLDEKITNPACKYIKDPHDKPFFLVCSYNNPHDICQLARGQKLPISPIPSPPPLEECPPLPSNFLPSENEPSLIREIQEKHRAKLYPTQDWGEKEWREYLWGYYRLIEKTDKQVEKLLDALKTANLLENTVILYVSDHGEGMATHQWNQKQILYENVARVNFLVTQVGKTPRNLHNTTHLVSTGLDLFPTICDFAGINPPSSLLGRSVKSLALGEEIPLEQWRPYVYTATEFGQFKTWAMKSHYNPMGRMVRSRRFKYCVYSRGESRHELFNQTEINEQLFDLQEDPGEMKNLALDSAYNKILQEHRNALVDWCRKTQDDFFTPQFLQNLSFGEKFREWLKLYLHF